MCGIIKSIVDKIGIDFKISKTNSPKTSIKIGGNASGQGNIILNNPTININENKEESINSIDKKNTKHIDRSDKNPLTIGKERITGGVSIIIMNISNKPVELLRIDSDQLKAKNTGFDFNREFPVILYANNDIKISIALICGTPTETHIDFIWRYDGGAENTTSCKLII